MRDTIPTRRPTALDDVRTYGPLGAELNCSMERRRVDLARRRHEAGRWNPLRLRVATTLISVGSRLAGTPMTAIPGTGPRIDPATPA